MKHQVFKWNCSYASSKLCCIWQRSSAWLLLIGIVNISSVIWWYVMCVNLNHVSGLCKVNTCVVCYKSYICITRNSICVYSSTHDDTCIFLFFSEKTVKNLLTVHFFRCYVIPSNNWKSITRCKYYYVKQTSYSICRLDWNYTL